MEREKSGWRIWLYLTPVYIIAAVPLIKWTMRVNSSDMALPQDTYTAFNSQEGEIKKKPAVVYTPELSESAYSLNYRSAKDSAQEKRFSYGFTKGYLTRAISNAADIPQTMGRLLNDREVIRGFMSRSTVKAATASPGALEFYLKDGKVIETFMANTAVKRALDDPQTLAAAQSSALVKTLLNTPAGKALLNDPAATAGIISSNPALKRLIADRRIKGLLMSDPKMRACIALVNDSDGHR